MFDKEIALDSLQKIKAMLDLIVERTSVVETPNDFLCSPEGMLRLDAICMNLIALGETVKGLDKQTGGGLLKNFRTYIGKVLWEYVTRFPITISK